MVSSCSFDGHVSVFSLMGGAPPTQTSNKVQHIVCTESERGTSTISGRNVYFVVELLKDNSEIDCC